MREEKLTVQGFRAAAVKGGIRGKDRLDIGLIVSDVPAVAAGVFTTSLVKAAPVLLDMARLRAGQARALVVNAGIANACTGELGMANALAVGRMTAEALGLVEDEVLLASTGVIGAQLDLACFQRAVPAAVARLYGEGFAEVSRAMMTTDTVPKVARRTVMLDGKPVELLGLAKGAGMIMPNMATMLAFVMTDACVASAAVLQPMLKSGVEKSFNRITIDGDTSTNDSVLLLANGLAANTPLTDDSPGRAEFAVALDELLLDLAMQIVADGEGATKLITIRVLGAATAEEAQQAARTIANSPLVKTAFFGEDANWGRIIGALGRSGAGFDANQVSIAFDDVVMVQGGLGMGPEVEARATEVLKRKRFTVTVDIHAGSAAGEYYTCDFSIDYVKINADYRS